MKIYDYSIKIVHFIILLDRSELYIIWKTMGPPVYYIINYAIMKNGVLCVSKRECKGEIRGVNTVKMPLNKSLILSSRR